MKKSEFKEMINRGTELLSDYEINEIFENFVICLIFMMF